MTAAQRRQEIRDRSERVRRERCLACVLGGRFDTCGKTEEHHLNFDGKAGQERLGQEFSIPLGRWHHQGIPLKGKTPTQMEATYGPSLKLASRKFRKAYGSDKELLRLTNLRVGYL